MPDYAREVATAMAAAREAGRVILRHYGQGGVAVETKADNSPVTIADREANASILTRLAALFPDDAILSEEAPDDHARLQKSRVWIVDPLDGTRDFVARTGEFCVHVGLAVDGIATVGVVHHPVSDATFVAARGAGAFVEIDGVRTRLGVSDVSAPGAVRLGVSRLNLDSNLRQALASADLEKQAISMGASVKLMAVARGTLDAVVTFSVAEMEWDTCAPEVIVEEAGGRFTDLEGRPFTYNQVDLAHRCGSLASNGACHAALLELLRPYFPFPSRPDSPPASRGRP